VSATFHITGTHTLDAFKLGLMPYPYSKWTCLWILL